MRRRHGERSDEREIWRNVARDLDHIAVVLDHEHRTSLAGNLSSSALGRSTS